MQILQAWLLSMIDAASLFDLQYVTQIEGLRDFLGWVAPCLAD